MLPTVLVEHGHDGLLDVGFRYDVAMTGNHPLLP